MTSGPMRGMGGWRVDEAATRHRFEQALAEHEQEFETFFLAKLFGLRFEYSPGRCRVDLAVDEFMLNPRRGVHGGVIAFALDTAMGHLCRHEAWAGITLATDIRYLRPLEGDGVCEATFDALGDTLAVVSAQMHDATGGLCAVARSTWMRIRGSESGDVDGTAGVPLAEVKT